MAAVILSLTVSFIVGVVVWLTVGPRLTLNADDKQNEVLNLFAYVAIAFPFAFGLVFFAVEKL